MKKSDFTLASVRRLCRDVYELLLIGDASDISAPGQFVHIALPGRFLRRPVSVCDWSAGWIVLLVKEAGEGTGELVRMTPGTRLDVLTGLGNGFDLSILADAWTSAGPEREADAGTEARAGTEAGMDAVSGTNAGPGTEDGASGGTESVNPDRVVLAGGGIGIAPLYALARVLRERGIVPTAAMGFRSAEDAFYLDRFAALGCKLSAATEDGSLPAGAAKDGISRVRGYVTDLLASMPERDYVFCCGPSPMLRAVHALPHLSGGQFSFEARMACGFGACMGCSLATSGGMKRVCKDGPVFRREEIVW